MPADRNKDGSGGIESFRQFKYRGDIKMIQSSVSGKSGITYVSVILLLIVVVGGYAGYTFIPTYMADWNFRREINAQMIKASEVTDNDIRQALVNQAAILKIPLVEGDLEITRNLGVIKIIYKYDRPVLFPGMKTIHFQDSQEKPIKKVDHLIPR
jgi:hypothetical protein